MSRVKYDDLFSYEIFDDGYDIYSSTGNAVLRQRDPFGKPYDADKSYEENCIMQIQSMEVEPEPSQEDKNRADIEYLALMMDIELPGEDIEEETDIEEEGE